MPRPAAGAPATGRRRESLSLAQARRIALAAQGFADPPRDTAPGWGLRRVLDRVGLLQIDSVNVLVRAHYMPAFSRMGPYPRAALDRLSHHAPRRLFEYWGHEASLLPVELHPLLRWRMARAHDDAWGGMRRVAVEQPALVARMLDTVRERGPVPASALVERAGPSGPWWDWTDGKRALEYLFWSGQVTSARRGAGFERHYDLPERVLPRAVLEAPTPAPEEAQRELLRRSARRLGVATERDLRDYFRLSATDARIRLGELVEAGDLLPVAVEGWSQPAYLHPLARLPRRVDARALLVPFDPLIWERDRVERLFGFRYRIEIYVPAERRVHGYYVLPLLLGDRLVARVDLKADRAAGALLVRAAHHEPSAPAETAGALQEELETLAGWLGLDRVVATS
jgi:hypothetical protein